MQTNEASVPKAESRGQPPRLGLVIPCFNEEEALPDTMRSLSALLDRLVDAQAISDDSRAYYVDDGSRDRTWAMITSAATRDPRVAGIKLSRNRGHQNALLAGLFTAEGEALISLDADLQDDIGVIETMLEHHAAGSEVVYGVRRDRSSDRAFKRTSARAFYAVMRWLGAESIPDHADFRLMGRRAVEALKLYREVNLFLRGIVPLIGFRTSIVTYERKERVAGTTKYPLTKMIALALQAVTSFSVIPLRLISLIGFAVFAFSAAMVVWTLWVRLFTDEALPGWTSTTLPIYLLGGLQILCLGVIGEYLGKLYQEVKNRPRYIIERHI